jgi:hypothetical protein
MTTVCDWVGGAPLPKDPVETCPHCGTDLWGVEYAYGDPDRYDGVSEWVCPNPSIEDSHYRLGRFSRRVLRKGEKEPRPR